MQQSGYTVIAYHHVAEAVPRKPKLGVAPRVFSEQINELVQRHYQFASLGAVLDRDDAPVGTSGPVIAVTFDDGYTDVLNAMPTLLEFGIEATIFVVASWVSGRRDCLNAPQLRELARLGMSIGVHSWTHPYLTRLPPAETKREILDARACVEDLLGCPCIDYCYPYGDVNPSIRRKVARAGFRSSCTTVTGVNTTVDDPLMIRRIAAEWQDTGPALVNRIQQNGML